MASRDIMAISERDRPEFGSNDEIQSNQAPS
jgi:hypothetical protein